VLRNGEPVAEIERRLTIGPSCVEIRNLQTGETIEFRDGGIYDGEALVGRIYDIRNYLYLDVRQSRLDDAVLGFYVAMLS
jgi:hypothetical protein